MNRIEVSYSRGVATVTIPGKGPKRKPLVIKLNMDEANAIVDAIKFNGMWVGDGYTHYDWPVQERKVRQKRSKPKLKATTEL